MAAYFTDQRIASQNIPLGGFKTPSSELFRKVRTIHPLPRLDYMHSNQLGYISNINTVLGILFETTRYHRRPMQSPSIVNYFTPHNGSIVRDILHFSQRIYI